MGREYRKKLHLGDWHLWTEVTRSVRPFRPQTLSGRDAAHLDEPPSPPKTATAPAPNSPGAKALRPNIPLKPKIQPAMASQGHNRQHQKPIEPRLGRKLRRGHLPIDGTIDLHGMRQDEAHAALCRFIPARFARGDRTILVITGKGLKKTGFGQIEQKGVLRSMLPVWLNEQTLSPMIAGWEHAAQDHGGEGAFYVRLKRRPE